MSTAPATPLSLETSLGGVYDFPDRLHPLVVKELRRSLRSLYFVLPFLILPAALALLAVWALARPDPQQAHRVVSIGLWYAVTLLLYGFKPVQALQAIRGERTSQALELLLVTRLTPARIVLGKWFSLEAQSLLFLSALLPFFVLRYFLGPVELVEVGLALMTSVVWTSFLTLVCLAISTFRRTAFWICSGLMVLTAPLSLLPGSWLGAALDGQSIGPSLLVLMAIGVGVLILWTLGFFAFAVATSNLGPLPTSRWQRAAAVARFAADATPAGLGGKAFTVS